MHFEFGAMASEQTNSIVNWSIVQMSQISGDIQEKSLHCRLAMPLYNIMAQF